MAVFSVGIDLVEIQRIEEAIQQYGERFLRRIYTPQEVEYCRRKADARSFAARFAAKEAVAKALGVGIAQGIRWTNVEVLNDSRGKPYLKLHGEAAELCERKKLHLSLSHSRTHAIAMVVVEEESSE